MTRGAQKF